MEHIAFAFSPETGEYLGPVPAQDSPLEPGTILRPRNAIFDAPPTTAQKECAVFAVHADGERDSLVNVSGTWSIVVDWRSAALYSTTDGARVTIDRLGVVPDPARMTEKPRPSDQHAWIDGDWSVSPERVAEAVQAQRDIKLQAVRLKMAPLQDAVDISEETAEEAALLIEFKQYAVALSRIEQQPGFPLNVAWPVSPE